MQSIDFEGELSKILDKDQRYHREAYVFLRHALDHCHKTLSKITRKKEGPENHVSVDQLLDGVRTYALQEYGPMAMMVLNSWGVEKCEDFGNIVFNMVEFRLLSTTENDTIEDFRKGYDFYEAFRAPFVPAKKSSPKNPAAEPSAK
jgi:uncharacterized repeat protein (TIGR04138 family)